jgi:hypothetical protein
MAATTPPAAAVRLAREALDGKVEAVVDDFAKMDITAPGRFDVVLFSRRVLAPDRAAGHPGTAAQVTDEVAVIETEALLFHGQQYSRSSSSPPP